MTIFLLIISDRLANPAHAAPGQMVFVFLKHDEKIKFRTLFLSSP